MMILQWQQGLSEQVSDLKRLHVKESNLTTFLHCADLVDSDYK